MLIALYGSDAVANVKTAPPSIIANGGMPGLA